MLKPTAPFLRMTGSGTLITVPQSGNAAQRRYELSGDYPVLDIFAPSSDVAVLWGDDTADADITGTYGTDFHGVVQTGLVRRCVPPPGLVPTHVSISSAADQSVYLQETT